MAQGSIAPPQAVPFRPFKQFVKLLPGVLLLAVIGYLGKFAEQSISAYAKARHLHVPNIEYVLWAIIFGLIIGNTINLPKVFQAGIGSYEFFLKAGIVLLGARFLLGDVAKLGGIPVGFAFVGSAAPYIDASDAREVTEFFVVRRQRGRGVAQELARHIWGLHPGRWLVRVALANRPALAFWRRAIKGYAGTVLAEDARTISGTAWTWFTFIAARE